MSFMSVMSEWDPTEVEPRCENSLNEREVPGHACVILGRGKRVRVISTK